MERLQWHGLIGLLCLSWGFGAIEGLEKTSSTTGFVPYKYFIEVKKKFNDETHPSHSKFKPWDKDELTEDQKRRLIALDIKKKVEIYVEEGNEEQEYDHKGHDKHETAFDQPKYYQNPPSNVIPEASQSKPQRVNPPTASSTPQTNRPPVPLLQQNNNSPSVNTFYDEFIRRHKTFPLPGAFSQTDESVVCPEPFRRDFPGPKDPALQRPRIQGVGDTVECLRIKYFGANPLDDRIFEQFRRYYP